MKVMAAALLAGMLAIGCSNEVERNPNVVDPALLRPKLLDDRREIAAYTSALPPGVYQEFFVPHIGKFYLDELPEDGIKQWLRKGVIWEEHLLRQFQRYVKRDSTVIDAGAHIGTHTLPFARLVGSAGRVYAFEPQKKLYRELVHNAKLNGLPNIVALRFALGAEAGVIEMDAASTKNEGGTGVGRDGDRAELRPLDSFGFNNVSLIKIDVEGFEDHVLDGARLTIARNRPAIIIEIMGGTDHAKAPPKVRSRIEATKAKLAAMGYQVTHIGPHDYLALPVKDLGRKP